MRYVIHATICVATVSQLLVGCTQSDLVLISRVQRVLSKAPPTPSNECERQALLIGKTLNPHDYSDPPYAFCNTPTPEVNGRERALQARYDPNLGGLSADTTPLPIIKPTQIPQRRAEVDWEQTTQKATTSKKPRLPPQSPVPANTEWEGNAEHSEERIKPTPIGVGIARREDAAICLQHVGDFDKLTAPQLFREYHDNELAADMRYKGKCVSISGYVAEISRDLTGTPYLLLHAGSGVFWVQLFFDGSHVANLAKVRRRWFFAGSCIVRGRALGQVVMSNCLGRASSE